MSEAPTDRCNRAVTKVEQRERRKGRYGRQKDPQRRKRGKEGSQTGSQEGRPERRQEGSHSRKTGRREERKEHAGTRPGASVRGGDGGRSATGETRAGAVRPGEMRGERERRWRRESQTRGSGRGVPAGAGGRGAEVGRAALGPAQEERGAERDRPEVVADQAEPAPLPESTACTPAPAFPHVKPRCSFPYPPRPGVDGPPVQTHRRERRPGIVRANERARARAVTQSGPIEMDRTGRENAREAARSCGPAP